MICNRWRGITEKVYKVSSEKSRIKEEAPMNATGPGVAGITGEPPGPKNIFARLRRKKPLRLEGDWKTKYAGHTPDDVPDEPEGTYQDFVNSWNSHLAKKKEPAPTPRIEKSPGIKAALARAFARRHSMGEVAEFPASGGSSAIDTRLYPSAK
jgi:hypothetical protein